MLAPDALRARRVEQPRRGRRVRAARRRGDRHLAAASAATTSSCAATGPRAWARRREHMISGVPAHVDGRMIAITRGGRRRGHPPRPHVALHRGHPQLGPDLAHARHPDPARARRRCGSTRPGTRLPVPLFPGFDTLGTLAHITHDRPRPHLVRADPEDHREGVRALGLRAEPGHHRQERARAAALAGRLRRARRRSRRSRSTARTSSSRDDLRALVDGMNAPDRDAAAGLRDRRGGGRRPRPRVRQPVHARTCRSRRSTAPAATSPTASPASPRRTSCSTPTPGR